MSYHDRARYADLANHSRTAMTEKHPQTEWLQVVRSATAYDWQELQHLNSTSQLTAIRLQVSQVAAAADMQPGTWAKRTVKTNYQQTEKKTASIVPGFGRSDDDGPIAQSDDIILSATGTSMTRQNHWRRRPGCGGGYHQPRMLQVEKRFADMIMIDESAITDTTKNKYAQPSRNRPTNAETSVFRDKTYQGRHTHAHVGKPANNYDWK